MWKIIRIVQNDEYTSYVLDCGNDHDFNLYSDILEDADNDYWKYCVQCKEKEVTNLMPKHIRLQLNLLCGS